MTKIFWGYLLIFLDINLSIGTMNIDFLPDFIGFYFVIQGLKSLKEIDTTRTRNVAICTLIISLSYFCVDFSGYADLFDNSFGQFLGIIFEIANFLVLYFITKHYEELETIHQIDFNSQKIMPIVVFSLIVSIVAQLGSAFVYLALVLIFIDFIAYIYLLILLKQAADRYPTTPNQTESF